MIILLKHTLKTKQKTLQKNEFARTRAVNRSQVGIKSGVCWLSVGFAIGARVRLVRSASVCSCVCVCVFVCVCVRRCTCIMHVYHMKPLPIVVCLYYIHNAIII